MALSTDCQTKDAHYNIKINSKQIEVFVKLPFELKLTEEQAIILEANIHNVMELVLSKHFK